MTGRLEAGAVDPGAPPFVIGTRDARARREYPCQGCGRGVIAKGELYRMVLLVDPVDGRERVRHCLRRCTLDPWGARRAVPPADALAGPGPGPGTRVGA